MVADVCISKGKLINLSGGSVKKRTSESACVQVSVLLYVNYTVGTVHPPPALITPTNYYYLLELYKHTNEKRVME
ncbi:unnamed protein product [Allacma fusca]|uniref:Uncharacterized protein n=1 Tax=Allacma fusca TaxID=39272 RepID=A0A8J2NVK2_9HEXA|nr:unnamed protein product [Allacma fusca]